MLVIDTREFSHCMMLSTGRNCAWNLLASGEGVLQCMDSLPSTIASSLDCKTQNLNRAGLSPFFPVLLHHHIPEILSAVQSPIQIHESDYDTNTCGPTQTDEASKLPYTANSQFLYLNFHMATQSNTRELITQETASLAAI